MENFYLNESNVFKLPKEIDFSIEMIQVSIIEQTKGVDKISDLLSQNIDVDKGILYDDKLTINFIYKTFLSLDNNSISITNITKCSIILYYLQLILFNEYVKNVHKNLLTLSEYQNRYDDFLNEFLNLNVDVDENDFIDAELKICNDVLIELDKQIYSSITTNQILEKNIPCDFKVSLIYSLNKRIKFLNDKYSISNIEFSESLEYDNNIFRNENAYKLFLEFTNNITNPYIDYSFIFQQMKLDILIYDMRHNKFIGWLIEKEFIKGKVIDEFNINGGLRTLKKSTNTYRLNTYINLKERYII
ncbi:hypothetical protein [Empedobacter falsenii]